MLVLCKFRIALNCYSPANEWHLFFLIYLSAYFVFCCNQGMLDLGYLSRWISVFLQK